MVGLETSITPSEAASGSGTVAETAKLRRVLRLQDLVLLIIGTVIGSGIFLVPGGVLKAVGGSLAHGRTIALVWQPIPRWFHHCHYSDVAVVPRFRNWHGPCQRALGLRGLAVRHLCRGRNDKPAA